MMMMILVCRSAEAEAHCADGNNGCQPRACRARCSSDPKPPAILFGKVAAHDHPAAHEEHPIQTGWGEGQLRMLMMMMMRRMMMRMKMATRRRGSYAHNFCGNFNNLGEATINLEKEKFFSFKKNTKYQSALKGECF